jgi:hypothetical protein
MDTKLSLLKDYLDSKVTEYATSNNIPFGDSILKFRMLCNSSPGVLQLAVSLGRPDDTFDLWYDLSRFYEYSVNGWVEFTEYKSEFTTTIVDIGAGDNKAAPTMVIEGADSFCSDDSSKYNAVIYYNKTAYSVTAEWSISINVGTIDNSGRYTV